MTIDHFSFNVPPSKYEEVVNWYLAALAPLNYTKQINIEGVACGLGDSPYTAKFWIGQNDDPSKQVSGVFHLGFKAKDHAAVDKFYEKAIKAGGTDNGKPGLRTMYHPNYYGAFVVDPLGLVPISEICMR
jgi:hypothetical protein